MTSEGLGEVFIGDSADTCAGKFPPSRWGNEVLLDALLKVCNILRSLHIWVNFDRFGYIRYL
jgi:hypothetical protein